MLPLLVCDVPRSPSISFPFQRCQTSENCLGQPFQALSDDGPHIQTFPGLELAWTVSDDVLTFFRAFWMKWWSVATVDTFVSM